MKIALFDNECNKNQELCFPATDPSFLGLLEGAHWRLIVARGAGGFGCSGGRRRPTDSRTDFDETYDRCWRAHVPYNPASDTWRSSRASPELPQTTKTSHQENPLGTVFGSRLRTTKGPFLVAVCSPTPLVKRLLTMIINWNTHSSTLEWFWNT